LPQKYGARLGTVEALVKVAAGVSGGTIASVMEMMDQRSGSLRQPFLLNPRGQLSSIRITKADKDCVLPFYHSTAQ